MNIIELAKDVWHEDVSTMDLENLERFAALVRAECETPLKLAEEALEYHTRPTCMCFAGCPDCDQTYAPDLNKALAAIREARRAEQSIVLNDPHPPHRLCECTACLEYWTPLPDCDAFAASGKPIAEPVKQEPVAWHEPNAYGNVTTHKKWAEENGWLPLYTKE